MPTTSIGTHPNDTGRLRLRGHDTLSEIVGELSFTEGFYLLVTGRRPSPAQSKLLDASLLILMDHGLTPSALVARLVSDSNPDDIQIPLAAGALMIGNRFAGTMAGAGRILSEGMAFSGEKSEWARSVVQKFQEAKRRVPGFGHPNYKEKDPRAARLFTVADAAGVKGDYISLLKLLSEAIDTAAGKPITLNVTGALAAVLHEIEFPVDAMRAVAVVGRCAGLVGHVLEERTNPLSPELFAFSESVDYLE
ncbi:citryl-CoA lyase [Paraburkholderia dipogonis]|uniref:citrate synthase (unknown stereospecificity) n=1 Tax=Paraburkholderia dipogonis TaxID=1211383 RepID=A0A4Y8MK68_9BURK|nr:citryl-CoA lyase [Paraburkholderia dipogonis]TFE37815.1 citryl-CoA lyase [Paraburkholderia dipogonis]